MTLLYFSDSIGRLATVDVDTGIVNVIGLTGYAFTDLAFAPSGQLFGITADNAYTIDIETAEASYVGALPVGNMGGAVFGIDGSLYTASFGNDTLVRIDAATGAAISTTQTGYVTEGDLFYREGVLHLNSTNNEIIALNQSLTSGTALLDYGTLNITGLANTVDGRVFGFASNRLYEFDLDTGTVSVVANISGVSAIQGAATQQEVFNSLVLINGIVGPEVINGTSLPERILANSGDDTIFGGAGADSIHGQAGRDLIYGNEGADTIQGNDQSDVIYAGKDSDHVLGGEGNDVIYGNLDADTLDGGTTQDVLYGGQGADSLYGGAGDDTLWGNRDDDILTGGQGSDIFVFKGQSGNDIVTDFTSGLDTLWFATADSGFDSFADVVAASAVSGGNLIISLLNGGSVTLLGVTNLGLTADDVAFF